MRTSLQGLWPFIQASNFSSFSTAEHEAVISAEA